VAVDVTGGARQAVLQDHAHDAALREPAGHVMALLVQGQQAVAAPRADHDRGPGLCALRGEVRGDGRDMNARHVAVAAPLPVPHDLVGRRLGGAGDAGGPELQLHGLRRSERHRLGDASVQRGGQEGCDEQGVER